MKLPGPIKLAKETIQIFSEKFFPLLTLSIGLIISSTLVREIFFGNNSVMLIGSVLLMLVIHVVTIGATFYVIAREERSTSPLVALSYAWNKKGDLFWLLILNLLLGGAYAFFIIPGIVFQIWFSLGFIILVVEAKDGSRALLASREYVRGHEWEVFLHIGFLALITMLFSYLLDSLPIPSGIARVISTIIQVFAGPFIAIYLYLIYNHLKKMSHDIDKKITSQSMTKYLSIGALGCVLIVVFGPILLYSDLFLGDTLPAFEKLKELKGENLPPEAVKALEQLAVPASVYELAPTGDL